MNKNVMCVCVGRDTSNIRFYDVDVIGDKVETIKLKDWKEAIELNPKEMADLIIHLCDGYDEYSAIIIDSLGIGIAVIDELEKDREFTVPIFKARPNKLNITEGIAKLNNYIQDNKFTVEEDVEVDLKNFGFKKLLPNGMLSLDVKEQEKEFSNIAQLFSFINECVLDNKKFKNKSIIEKNLREILEILVDDLCNVDKSNAGAVNDLVRLIDKINYIRGQY